MGNQAGCGGSKRSFLSCSVSERRDSRGAAAATSSAPVSLHVYDVGPTRLNDVLRPLGTGMFHVGVEIYLFEWAFCSVGDPVTGSGIFCAPPREACNYDYRESVDLGHTAMNAAQVRGVLDNLHARWPARGYDTLRRNCCHFANELCQMLGVSLDDSARVLLRMIERGGPDFCCAPEEVERDHEDLGLPLVVSVPTLAPPGALKG
ncbi:unnamed protein product, partial [Prorocentrum cordatum]